MIPLAGAVVTLISMMYVTARIDVRIALVVAAVAPAILVLMRGYKSRMRGRYREAKELESSALHVVQETLGAFRVVKVFGREQEHSTRFEQSQASMRAQVWLAAAEGVYGMSVQMVTGVGTAVVLYLGTTSVLSGTLSVGDLTLIMAYLARLFAPLQTISKISASLQGYLASAQRVFEVLDELPDVADRPGARRVDRVDGRIDARGLGFAYHGEDRVLSDVSLAIRPGARAASSDRPVRGRPRCSACSCASTTRRRARCSSTATTCATSSSPTCASSSPSCCRTPSCSRRRSPRTSVRAPGRNAGRGRGRGQGRRGPRIHHGTAGRLRHARR